MSKDNVNLPKTAFSMKANLQNKEPGLIDFWDKIELYKKLRSSSKGKEKFVLHDGPPYANGNIHMGTAFNKILKDLIVKFHQMSGKDSVYVPGWDCHGLPIEWKIEEQYKKNKKNKNDVPINDIQPTVSGHPETAAKSFVSDTNQLYILIQYFLEALHHTV